MFFSVYQEYEVKVHRSKRPVAVLLQMWVRRVEAGLWLAASLRALARRWRRKRREQVLIQEALPIRGCERVQCVANILKVVR